MAELFGVRDLRNMLTMHCTWVAPEAPLCGAVDQLNDITINEERVAPENQESFTKG